MLKLFFSFSILFVMIDKGPYYGKALLSVFVYFSKFKFKYSNIVYHSKLLRNKCQLQTWNRSFLLNNVKEHDSA